MDSCLADLTVAWQAESALVQVLMFSLLLITVALTLQHLSKADSFYLQKKAAFSLAIGLSTIAVSFSLVGVYAYASRSGQVRVGCGDESFVHKSVVFLASLLILLELVFMAITFVATSTRAPSPST